MRYPGYVAKFLEFHGGGFDKLLLVLCFYSLLWSKLVINFTVPASTCGEEGVELPKGAETVS